MTRTVVVGNRALAKHVLRFLLQTDWNVVGTVTPGGRAARKQAGYVPFEDVADDHGLELIETEDINDSETVSRLEDVDPDLCICPGWHQIIDEQVLDIPDRGFVGFHAGDLPRERGGAPVNWTIIHGKSEIVLSLFYFSPGVDAGDVIHKEKIEIEGRDDVSTVLEKLAVAACEALATMRDAFESGQIEATLQSTADATYRPRRQPQDGLIDWSRHATDLRNWVRAQTDPYPGAYTFCDAGRLTIWSAEVLDRSSDTAEPGTIVDVVPGEGIDVATGNTDLRLTRVQLKDRPRMWADDFARHHGTTAGDSLGTQHAPSAWLYTSIRDEHGGTDFSEASNLRVGEAGTVVAVVESRTDRTINVRASYENSSVAEESVTCPGRQTVPITYEAADTGTKTLGIEFFDGDERVDRRYLKVFVSR